MNPSIPKTMKASVIDQFGGPEVLHVATIPVPEPGDAEVLIRVHTAGIGAWDPWLREGGSGVEGFPQVLGTDGAGTVEACGSNVRRFKVGDRVCGFSYDSPKGGFYAEYAAVSEDNVASIPGNISMEEAGVLPASGITALQGLDVLKVRRDCALMILGASGGVGHVALQLAKRIGARLLAIASGDDGVDLVRKLGADQAVNGRNPNVVGSGKGIRPERFGRRVGLLLSRCPEGRTETSEENRTHRVSERGGPGARGYGRSGGQRL